MAHIIHLLNGKLVNEGIVREGHLIINGGRIASISEATPSSAADEVIDAKGAWVLPGLIDDQVHFREPGFPKKGTIRTESMAAVAGGVTSFMEMPNTYPPTTEWIRLEEKLAIAAKDSVANYSFFLGASNTNLDVVRSADPRRIAGIKVFMGSSTGNMRVSDPEVLEQVFKESPTLVATHCEDDDAIASNLERYRAVWGEAIPARYHPDIRSREACFASSRLAVELARKHGTHLHVLHITTAEELALFSPGEVASKTITAEACVHHLFFNDTYYATLGHRLKCNPAVKTEMDRQALLQALRDGRIDVIATDHAPHELAYKQNAYTQAPSGLPLAQDTLPVLLELVHRGELSITELVKKTSHAVAERFKVVDRGYLREGAWADLVVCRLREDGPQIGRDPIYSLCGWSPFEQIPLHGVVQHTLVSGRHLYAENRFLSQEPGQALIFDR